MVDTFLYNASRDPTVIMDYPEELQTIEIALAVLRQGDYYQYVRPDLQRNPTIIRAAIQQNVRALDASPHLKADREVVLAAVQQNGQALQYASRELKADPYILLHASVHGYKFTPKEQAIILDYIEKKRLNVRPPIRHDSVRPRTEKEPLQHLYRHGPFANKFFGIIHHFANPDEDTEEEFKRMVRLRGPLDQITCTGPACAISGGKRKTKRRRRTFQVHR